MKHGMKKNLLAAAATVLCGLPLAAIAQSGEAGQPARQEARQKQQNIRDMRASELIGATVRDRQGKDIGEVQDLIVDAGKQRVEYAILAFGGTMGFGEKLFAYPMDRFEATMRDDDKELVLNVSEKELEAAPGFDRSNWPTFGMGGYRGEVDKHFGRTAQAGGNLVRMSELMDTQISDRGGKDIGEINDVVVSVKDGQVRFVALQPEGDLGLGDRLVMLPMSAIEATSEQAAQSSGGTESSGAPPASEAASGDSGGQAARGGRDDDLGLVLTIPAEQLQNARSFQEDQWPDINSPAFQRDMDRYVAAFPQGGSASGGSGEAGSSSSGGSGAKEEERAPGQLEKSSAREEPTAGLAYEAPAGMGAAPGSEEQRSSGTSESK